MDARCLCRRNWFLRDPYNEGQQGQYPMPNHHPDCDAFKTEKFFKVALDGSWFICEPSDLADHLLAEEETERLTISIVKLTRDQFENLEEFSGF